MAGPQQRAVTLRTPLAPGNTTEALKEAMATYRAVLDGSWFWPESLTSLRGNGKASRRLGQTIWWRGTAWWSLGCDLPPAERRHRHARLDQRAGDRPSQTGALEEAEILFRELVAHPRAGASPRY